MNKQYKLHEAYSKHSYAVIGEEFKLPHLDDVDKWKCTLHRCSCGEYKYGLNRYGNISLHAFDTQDTPEFLADVIRWAVTAPGVDREEFMAYLKKHCPNSYRLFHKPVKVIEVKKI
jgi:hypothetical protein